MPLSNVCRVLMEAVDPLLGTTVTCRLLGL